MGKYSDVATAPGESALTKSVASHPKLRFEAMVSDYPSDGDSKFRKEQLKRLKAKHKVIKHHIANFDKEAAAQVALKALHKERRHLESRMMEYDDDGDEMDMPMGKKGKSDMDGDE